MKCKSCLRILEGTDFYTSNKATCKECVKANVRRNRSENIDYYRSYDRLRYRESDERKEASRRCSNSPAGLKARQESAARTRANEPEKYKARNAVSNALRDGKLQKADSCYFCKSTTRLQAHHHDYNRPLDVFWLCASCHGKLHTINGDFLKSTG